MKVTDKLRRETERDVSGNSTQAWAAQPSGSHPELTAWIRAASMAPHHPWQPWI